MMGWVSPSSLNNGVFILARILQNSGGPSLRDYKIIVSMYFTVDQCFFPHWSTLFFCFSSVRLCFAFLKEKSAMQKDIKFWHCGKREKDYHLPGSDTNSEQKRARLQKRTCTDNIILKDSFHVLKHMVATIKKCCHGVMTILKDEEGECRRLQMIYIAPIS